MHDVPLVHTPNAQTAWKDLLSGNVVRMPCVAIRMAHPSAAVQLQQSYLCDR